MSPPIRRRPAGFDGTCADLLELLRRRRCAQMLLHCENDQAKLDRFSRLACSTNLSKILEGDPPERSPWDRGPGLRRGVLELDAPGRPFAYIRIGGRFCANLLKLSDFNQPVKADPNSGNLAGKLTGEEAALRKNLKYQPAKFARAAKARGRSTPGSCNGLFSLGIPYRGCGGSCLTRPNEPGPSLGFPLPSTGQAIRPPGGSTAYCSRTITNFQRIAQLNFDCKFAVPGRVPLRCSFQRIATRLRESKAGACGKPGLLWETGPWRCRISSEFGSGI
jgi:hypothetical protein